MSNAPRPTTQAAPSRCVLVRGVNWLGDAIMTTPALQRLRQRLASSEITLLAPQKLADLWLGHPSVDKVLTVAPGQGAWSIARQLRRAAPFDLALVLPNSPRSALETWLAGIPQRVGYARRWRTWLLTRAMPPRTEGVVMRRRNRREVGRLADRQPPPPPPPSAHQIHDYLHLASALGASPEPLPPLAQISDAEAEQLSKVLLADLPHPGAGRPPLLLGLNPGAEFGPAKRWPAERFAAVASEVARRLPACAWLVFGVAQERELCETVARAAALNALNLAGRTSLRQLMGLLKLCRVLLTNDSGSMHLAAALGTPVVVPFGSTSPALTGPGLPGDAALPHRLLSASPGCAPCFRRECPIDFRCMTALGVRQVADAVLAVVSRTCPL